MDVELGLIRLLLEGAAKYGLVQTLLVSGAVLVITNRVLGRHVKNYALDHFRRAVPENLERAKIVNGLLDALLSELGASRAFVCQLHNGGQNSGGLPFTKVSCTHERPQVGVRPKWMKNFKDVHVSICASWLKAMNLDRQKIFSCGDVACFETTDKSLHALMENYGIKSVYVVEILGWDRVPLGFVGVDYTRDERVLTEREKNTLQALALKICGQLMPGHSADSCRVPGEAS